MNRRWQNRIAESPVTLPTVCVVTTLLWWMPEGGYSSTYLSGWLMCALMSYFVLEMAAQNALLRVRSRMTSSLLLLLMATCGFLHPLQTGTVLQFCMALSYFYLLRTCEAHRPESDTMRAFLWLSLGSLLWPPFLLLCLVHLWSQLVYLRAISQRTLGAALIGIALPYILWATGAVVLRDMTPFVQHVVGVCAPFTEPFYWQWAVDYVHTEGWEGLGATASQHLMPTVIAHQTQLVALACVLLIGLTGFVHYLRNNYNDKIRVRMCFYSIMLMQVVLVLWMAFQPHHFNQLFPLLLFSSVPAAAHFIALTHTWLSNAWVIVLALVLLGVGVYTLVLPLYHDWPLPCSDLPLFSVLKSLKTMHLPLPNLFPFHS